MLVEQPESKLRTPVESRLDARKEAETSVVGIPLYLTVREYTLLDVKPSTTDARARRVRSNGIIVIYPTSFPVFSSYMPPSFCSSLSYHPNAVVHSKNFSAVH
jgi:hypothetical protein